MNKRKAAVAGMIAGTIAIGGIVSQPMSALAADTTTDATATATARTPGQWVTDALSGLVSDGTLTQDQSDKVTAALEAARPDGGRGMGGHGGRGGFGSLELVADKLSMTQDELRAELETKSIATVAGEKSVDLQSVIDAIVADRNARIDQAVTDGKLTQEEADTRKADVVQRVTAEVNEVRSGWGKGGPGGNRADSPASTDTTSTTTAA